MTNSQFLEQFGHFIEAPNGIQKLRELILRLAVQGQLVRQDPDDEAAEALLEEVKKAKQVQIDTGKVKAGKPLPSICADELPLRRLPDGWTYSRLGDLIRVINGRAYKKHEMLDCGTPLLRVGNLFTSSQWYYSDLELEEDKYCNPGDLIYAWSASFGPFIWKGPRAIYHYHIWKLDFFAEGRPFKKYLYTYLLEKTQEIKAAGHGISMAHMTKAKMEKLVVPVPPLAEQHRIVAKVDELMALCDRLEAERNARDETHQRLIRAVHHPLTEANETNGKEGTDPSTAWHRIRDNFADLYTSLDSVQALRKTIVQLAVVGKLEHQEETDHAAGIVLERIAAEKERLLAKNEIKRAKALPPVSEEMGLYELPASWEWTRLGAVVLKSEAGWSPKAEDTPATGGQWGVLKVSAVSWGKFRPEENKALFVTTEPKPQFEVRAGDFLISRANTADLVARSVVVDSTPPKLIMSDKIIRLTFSQEVDIRYINMFNSSGFARDYYARVAGGTSSSMKNVSRHQISCLPLALPPKNEQTRIVKKVESLMSFCDQLEASIRAKEETATHYAEAVVHQIAAA